MDLISIVLTFVCAYGMFMFLAYLLARAFFPKIEVDDDTDEKPRRLRTRQPKRIASRAFR